MGRVVGQGEVGERKRSSIPKVVGIIEAEAFPASMHWDEGRLIVVDGEAGCA